MLCRQFQKAAVLHAAARQPAEVAEILGAAIAGLARAYGLRAGNERPITTHNIWAALAYRNLGTPRAVRRLLRDYILAGGAVWEDAAWVAFLELLLPHFGLPPDGAEQAIADLCTFVADEKSDVANPELRSTKQAQIENVTLKLGSIHSVKGKSVDGILVVESEVWKGVAANDRCIDLSTVLPQAFGVANQPLTGIALTAATNVFVGVTRPRELLAMAVRKSHSVDFAGVAQKQGWKLVDLVERAGNEGELFAG